MFCHISILIPKIISDTYEIIFILKGNCKFTFFDKNDIKISTHIVKKNYAIITKRGGHSYKFYKGCKFVEIKQGPYFGKVKDKVYL